MKKKKNKRRRRGISVADPKPEGGKSSNNGFAGKKTGNQKGKSVTEKTTGRFAARKLELLKQVTRGRRRH